MKKQWITRGTLKSGNGALTSSYVTQGDIITGAGYEQLVLIIDYTKGDETSLDFKVQYSDTKLFTDVLDSIVLSTDATGISTVLTNTFTVTATKKFTLPIAMEGLYWRFQAKATGGTPTGTINVRYRLENVER